MRHRKATKRARGSALRIALLSLAWVGGAQAGGLGIYEMGTPDAGRAAAGRAAVAEDAATTYGNPAGMSELDRPQWLIGLQAVVLKSEFEPGDRTNVEGSDGGNVGGLLPSAGIYYAHPLSENWAAGLAIGSDLGLAVDQKDDWVGRYYVTESALLSFTVNPVVSYRVNDVFSVGGGVSVVAGVLDQELAINNPEPRVEDGRLDLEDSTVGFGINAGILARLSPTARVGITYRSPVELDFEDTANSTGLGPLLSASLGAAGLLGARLDLGLTLPQQVMVSIDGTFTEDLSVLANIGWQDWSDFGRTQVVVAAEDTTRLTADRKFDDTYHGALGLRYRLDPAWTLSAGFAYDTAAVEDRKRTIDLPLDRQLRYAAGAQYAIDDDLTVGLAYTFVDTGSARVDQDGGPLSGRVQGKFDPNHINIVNLNLVWRR